MTKKPIFLFTVCALTSGLLPVRAANLLAYFDFDDDSVPGSAVEVSGNAPDAALVGPAVLSADMGGVTGSAGDRALDLGGLNNGAAASVPTGKHLDPAFLNNALAVSFWQFNTGIGNSSSFWLISPTATGVQRGFQAHVPWSNGIVYFDSSGCCDSPGQRLTDGGGSVVTGAWQHWVFQKDAAGNKQIWRDGVLHVDQAGGANALLPFNGAVTIGAEGTAFLNSFGGLIDDFAIYDGALTQGEIESLANGTQQPSGIAAVPPDSDTDGAPDWWEDLVGFDKNDPADGASDGDGDGLTNAEEFTHCTDPFDADPDNDGLNDGDEVANGTDPANPDTDGDGLTDSEEVSIHLTDPLDSDSDDDTLLDGFEVASGLDPLDDGTSGESVPGAKDGPNGPLGDPDGDTITNIDEQTLGTNAGAADSDGDGLADNVETGTGTYVDATDTGTDPANPDSDGDGLSDGVEDPNLPFVDASQPGTNPNDADSDGDLFPDLFEIDRGSNPTDSGIIPPPDPLAVMAWWDFNDPSNPASTTDVVNGHVGTTLNGAAYTADMGGHTGAAGDYAMDFTNSATRSVRVTDASFLNDAAYSDEITIGFWQKLQSVAATSSFWGLSPSAAGGRGIQAHVPWSDSNIYYDHSGCCAGNQRIAKSGAGIDFTQWHHFVFLKKDGRVEIWIDGVLFHSGDSHLPLPVDFTELYLGSNQTPANSLNGFLDDFAVFNRGLDAARIRELAKGVSPVEVVTDTDQDGLPDYWEDQNGLSKNDPADAGTDSDGDGLDASAEFDAGSDPANSDSDGDGVNDGDELSDGTDPTNPDSDGDGFGDGTEKFYGTNASDGASAPSQLAADLCGYWRMENDLLDSSPFGHDASGRNGPSFAASPLGNAVVLDKPTHQYVVVDSGNTTPNTFNIDGNGVNESAAPEAGDVTISVWLKSAGFDQAWQAVVAKGEGSDYRLARRDQNDDVVYAGGTGTGGDLGTSPMVNVNDGGWHHVAVQTEDGVAKRLWVDGVKGEALGAADLNNNNSGADAGVIDWLMLGGNPDGNEGDANNNQYRTFGGCLDDIAFWKRALSEDEVLSIYNQGALLGRDLQFLIVTPDTDRDGVHDDDEINGTFGFVTDPNNPDTDGDGVPDGVELLRGSDPTVDDDPDGDGLPNSAETSGSGNGYDGAPTDPYNADSDGDGINDAEEGSAGADGQVTNPNSGDTDGDGHSDPSEISRGSDPDDAGSIPEVNLLLYYTFDLLYEGSVCNEGTLPNHGTVLGSDDGGGFYAPGRAGFGQALNGNRAASDNVRVDTSHTSADLGFQSGDATFMGWIFWNGPLGHEDHMIFGNDATESIHYGIRANNGGVNDAHFGTWGGDIGDAGTIPVGEWAHMAFVQDGPTGRVFINGVQTAAAGYGLNAATANRLVWIGGHPRDGIHSFNGLIDEVKVFDRALIPGEIVAAMNAPAPVHPVPANDLEAWRLHHFGTVADAGDAADSADPNNDGWENIFAFLLGLEPRAPGVPPVVDADVPGGILNAPGTPRIDIQNVQDGVNYCLVYSRRTDAAALGYSVDAEFSANMQDWFPNTGGETILATNGDYELVKVTIPFFLPDGRKGRFWHLVVTPND